MSRIYYEETKGHCPVYSKEATLTIKRIETPILGKRGPDIKRKFSSCDLTDDCRLQDECPVFKNRFE